MRARLCGFFWLLFLQLSCTSEGTLQNAVGYSGDIFLVMDKAQWKRPLGRYIDSVLRQPMQGLPRNEPIFHLVWIDPLKLNAPLRIQRNLIFVVTMDAETQGATAIKQLFTLASLKKIEEDTAQFNVRKKNMFAVGQEVLLLFSKNENILLEKLKRYNSRIISHFDDIEKQRLSNALLNVRKDVPTMLRSKYNCSINLPFGYKIVETEKDFFWARQMNPKDDKNIFFARQSYSSQGQFNENNLIDFRNTICRKYLFEDPDRPSTFLLTETGIEEKQVMFKKTTLHGKFAIEMRGLWRTHNLSMGGPFVSYALVDEPKGMMYYVEGFTYSPRRSQREIMRELETIIASFKTSDI